MSPADHDPLALLAEDVADLQARFGGLQAKVDGLEANVEQLADNAPAPARKKVSPKFILLLEEDDAYNAELLQLAPWVEGILLPFYGREVTQAAPWCPRWFDHPEAIARLHACWLAWLGLTDPKAGAGATGPSVWHRDHLDPMLAQLRAPDGPFAGCATSHTSTNHRVLPVPQHDECVPPPHDEPS